MSNNRNTTRLTKTADLIQMQDALSLSSDEVLHRLGTSASGLTAEEAEKRLATYGSNEVVKRGKRSAPIEFIAHFKSPVTIILIVAAIISGFVGDPVDAGIILFIVLVSVTLDFTQEFRAERAAEALRKRVATTATGLRNGAKRDIEVAGLVPGDLVLLSAGDIVPADARLVSAKDFFVDQSALTGESFPVEKSTDPVFSTSAIDSNKWNNYLFMGTSVTAGTATAVIIKTGGSTQ